MDDALTHTHKTRLQGQPMASGRHTGLLNASPFLQGGKKTHDAICLYSESPANSWSPAKISPLLSFLPRP